MQPLPDSQNPDSLVEVCRLLSQSGFYPLVSGLLPPPATAFLPYGLQVRRFGCLSSPLDGTFQGVLLTY
jgi:hypothetical protein